MVMHAPQAGATHLLVMDPNLHELESTGYLLWAQGYKVSLSSALLDPESLGLIAPDLLIVRPPKDQVHAWKTFVRTLSRESQLQDLPVVWLADRSQRLSPSSIAGCHVLAHPCTPLDLLTLVDTLVFTGQDPDMTSTTASPSVPGNAGHPVVAMFGSD